MEKNIKVHFAASENIITCNILKAMQVNYLLYTAFPFLERSVLKTKKSPLLPAQFKGQEHMMPKFIASNTKHTIQDSGLFTLMFGSHKGQKDEKLIEAWYNGLVEFTLNNNNGATIVEVDCQKVLGVEKAWQLRERMRNDIPNKQINVFHKEDGQKGLDRLIEFSDYIAISVPELRFMGQKNQTERIANYIKNKKPNVDIHLLGCTELKLLKQLTFCTSCDSTSYRSLPRYGVLKGRRAKDMDTKAVEKLLSPEDYKFIRTFLGEQYASSEILSIYYHKQLYTQHVGSQD